MIIENSRAAYVAVLPRPPLQYDAQYFARIVDVLNKALEQLQQPREITLSRLVVSRLGEESPLDPNCPGEVYIKDCPGCGVKVLAVDTSSIPFVQFVTASANMTLTGTAQDIPGASVILEKVGTYLLHGVILFVETSGDDGVTMIGSFDVLPSGPSIVFHAPRATGNDTGGGTVNQQATITIPVAPAVVKLRAYKTGGTGASYVNATHTTLSALWIA